MSDTHTLPLGVFSPPGGGHRRVGVRAGDDVVDLAALAATTGSAFTDILAGESLDPVLAAGRPVWEALREQVAGWIASGDADPWRVPLADVRMAMPFTVADYVDFYASEHHASAVGKMFRPGQPPLPRAWRHLPQGYHGRAGTVVVSGTPIRRPHGLRWSDAGDVAEYGPTRRLDVEVEIGFVVGVGSEIGRPLTTEDYRSHVFGLVVVNDWSARDIQGFETVPLGPHTGKSFTTSISPWVVQLAALDHLVVPVVSQGTPLAPYLVEGEPAGLDIDLQLAVDRQVVATQPYSAMHWSPAQMLAQLTVTGASTRTGDLYASGTVSGPDPQQAGSLLELWGGERFLDDGAEVTISASARPPAPAVAGAGRPANGYGTERLDLGSVTGRIAGC